MRIPIATALLAILLPAAGSTAQESVKAVRAALRAGQHARAADLLDDTARIDDPRERLAVSRELIAAVKSAPDRDVELRIGRHALRLLEPQVPADLRDDRQGLQVECGTKLVALLIDDSSAPADRDHVARVMEAREAMLADGEAHREEVAVAAYLVPRLTELRRFRDAVAVGSRALESAPDADGVESLRADLGIALLRNKNYEDALPLLPDYLASDPTDPARVLTVVDELPTAYSLQAYQFLLPVVGKEPRTQQDDPWRDCLSRAYRRLDKIGAKRDPGKSIWNKLIVRETFPMVWNVRIWRPGYRVYLDDNARPGKSSLGRDGVQAALPVSVGWRRSARPPSDLRRWDNCQLCFRRGDDGPVLAVYVFGPNLQYWYGDTPRERGVTAKTVRGHSTGSIARMVADIAYGEDARRNKKKFKKRSPLPFKLGASGQRKAWQLDDTIYDETFFAVGQVSVEVLLRIDVMDLELLEPEIRWLYRNIRP